MSKSPKYKSNKNKRQNLKSVNINNLAAVKEKQNAVEFAVVNIISLFVFIAFGYIAIMSLLQTSVIDSNNYVGEHILYVNDNIAVNLLIIALFGIFLFKIKKQYSFFSKINLKVFETLLFAYVVILGFIWIFSVQSIPGADSASIFEAASNAAKGSYYPFLDGTDFYNKDNYGGYSYFNFYPFQLGFVFLCEIIYRIFGTDSAMPLEIINVLCVAAAYLAIAKISKEIFNKRSIEFFTILLLAACFQPILLCSFAYGNIIGMCCALWASYFLIRYFKTEKYILLIPCGILLVVSTLAKYNNMIYLAAFSIMLIVHTVVKKKWQSIAFILAICIAAVGTGSLVKLSYENRAGRDFADGVSQVLYLNMGLNESSMAPGWYTSDSKKTYLNSGLDNEAANKIAKDNIKARLYDFKNNTDKAIDFFNKKILSQWNEPTYESIWVSKVKDHYSEINSVGKSMYEGSLGQFFELYFNQYMQIIFLLFATGIYCMFINRKTNILTVLLPLVILGGFGYHLLFEGKSQYVLTYIPLMIPTAAYAVNCIINGKYTRIVNTVAKLKEIPAE